MNTPLSLPSFSTPHLPLTRLFSAILFLVSFRFVLFTIHFISNTFTPASIRTDPNTSIYIKSISAPQQKQQQQQQIHPSRPPVIATSSMPSVSSEPIPNIDQLYSPKFPLEVVRMFVMEALKDAVEINQVHNRDPIGWTNENLFL